MLRTKSDQFFVSLLCIEDAGTSFRGDKIAGAWYFSAACRRLMWNVIALLQGVVMNTTMTSPLLYRCSCWDRQHCDAAVHCSYSPTCMSHQGERVHARNRVGIGAEPLCGLRTSGLPFLKWSQSYQLHQRNMPAAYGTQITIMLNKLVGICDALIVLI
jgi:hypothetical protein